MKRHHEAITKKQAAGISFSNLEKFSFCLLNKIIVALQSRRGCSLNCVKESQLEFQPVREEAIELRNS